MAVNRVPVLKRCRSLGMDPVYLGIDKKSTRQLNRKQNSSTAFWRNLLLTITKRLTEWKDRLVRT